MPGSFGRIRNGATPLPPLPVRIRTWSLRALRLLTLWMVVLIPLTLLAPPLWAAPVQWREVTATADGRQWWDAGSLRYSREGYLTVLSRFQPASPSASSPPDAAADGAAAEARPPQRQPASSLYVMEIDCDESLYRDRSINGFHQFSPQWQPVLADDLIGELIDQACAAAASSGDPSAPAIIPG